MIEVALPALTFLTQIIMGLTMLNALVSTDSADINEELYCLALNAYHEARGVGMDEMMAVSQVVMNRVNHSTHYTTVCYVITEGPTRESWRTRQDKTLPDEERIFYPVRGKCQFSWYCDGRPDVVRNMKGWEDAVIAAYLVYNGYGEDRVQDALHYYAHKKIVKPDWTKDMEVTAVLAGHTFLK